ncbi:flagellar biosynthesis repressor FlbT [Helicobacter cetorum]|uniref:flagellar biosynthesis repressor FlbT n=1 Tax=Helicobacter cetorum TaxID=138563 RepID=UPI000CF182D9|nr:flagellar biosynthesis repressor FlbT [Helicobacter cetorum]
MKIFKTLSLYTLLSLGIFSSFAYAEKLQDIANYPNWLKLNFFELDNPRNQYVGSASINNGKQDFYFNYIPYDEKLPPIKNAEKIAFLRAKLNAYSALESILITKKMRERLYETLQTQNKNINSLFKIVDFLVSKSILAKQYADTTNHRLYVMVQFPFIDPKELSAYFKKQNAELSLENAKAISAILNKTLFSNSIF